MSSQKSNPKKLLLTGWVEDAVIGLNKWRIPYLWMNIYDSANLNKIKFMLVSSAQLKYEEYLLRPSRFIDFLYTSDFISLPQSVQSCGLKWPLINIIQVLNSGWFTIKLFGFI